MKQAARDRLMDNSTHPWRVMALVLGGVLLCSYGLERLTAPAGTAVIAAMDTRPVTVTGTIEARAAQLRPVLRSSGAVYTLSDEAMVRPWTGRQVRVTGVLHKSTGVLDVHSVGPVDDRS